MSESFLPSVLGSAAAGIIARIFTHPLDTAKARLQATYTEASIHPPGGGSSSALHPNVSLHQNPMRYRGTVDVLYKTAHSEGIRGLYRGFGAVIVGGTPGTVLYLCSYDIAKKRLSDLASMGGEQDFVIHFASGMIAETVACVVYVPVDVVKERMQVQHKESSSSSSLSHRNYRNSWDALKTIMRTEGLSGIYKGYAATLGSFGPFSALYFVFYERFKYWTRLHVTGDENAATTMRNVENVEIPFSWLLLCSSSAGAAASWMTSPLDMAKLRLQVQRGLAAAGGDSNPSSPQSSSARSTYKGVYDCLKQSARTDGVSGLFRGAWARVIFTVPATTITMTSYEMCRNFIANAIPSS